MGGGAFREPIKACFTRADNAMKDANDVQSCLKSVCNRAFRPSSFTVPSKLPAVSRPFNGGLKKGRTGLAPTPIIYQFRILMSSRLIQKASTLRKRRERSWSCSYASRIRVVPCFPFYRANNGRRKRDGQGGGGNSSDSHSQPRRHVYAPLTRLAISSLARSCRR